MKYIYQMLTDASVDKLNELGEDGWKVVYTNIGKGFTESTLMEKEPELCGPWKMTVTHVSTTQQQAFGVANNA